MDDWLEFVEDIWRNIIPSPRKSENSREKIALAAMQELIKIRDPEFISVNQLAEESYRIADAMEHAAYSSVEIKWENLKQRIGGE